MQGELTIKQAEVEKEKAEVEALLDEIHEKTAIAEKHQAAAIDKKQQLDVENIEIAKQTKEAEIILENAKPELEGAMKLVEKIEKKDLETLRSYPSPPNGVRLVGQVMLLLKPTGKETDDDSWNAIKSLLSDPRALKDSLATYAQNRIKYCTQKAVNKINDKIHNNSTEFEKVKTGEISAAA
mmetsp:Transcript_28709/g.25802  ORF Transcript_28709/g.25802 Transcript_28709/m.25802 type:complete len:182 (-) Transcript_28709:585-1130(-)